MTQALQVASSTELSFTPDQERLIRESIARNATVDEFKLFMYRARSMGLDPLKPGQIHFIKYGTGPGAVVVGIEGFRAFAHRTGRMSGIERGVKRDEKGKLIYGWCRVHRKDWQHPAYEEVSFIEYDTGRNNWSKMPETMIKKVAEAATLRMAFPSELGGVYSEEEMEKAVEAEQSRVTPLAYGQPDDNNMDGIYYFPLSYGYPDPKAKDPTDPKSKIQLKGMDMNKMHERIWTAGIETMIVDFENILTGKKKTRMILDGTRKAEMNEFISVATAFLKSIETPQFEDVREEDVPF